MFIQQKKMILCFEIRLAELISQVFLSCNAFVKDIFLYICGYF